MLLVNSRFLSLTWSDGMMEDWNNVKTFSLYILIKSLESHFVVYPISLLKLRNKTHYSTILLFRFSD